MIATIVPEGVAVADSFGDPPEARLLPEEEAAVAGAVDERRREYTTVRHLARRAMAELGIPAVAVVSGARREPLWPSGVVGSLTHCRGYRAAALSFEDRLASVGIDAEPHEPLPGGVLARIALPEERARLAELTADRPDVHWDGVLFSAKEAVYKAWFPLAGRRLGLQAVTLDFDPASDAFTAEVPRPGPGPGPGAAAGAAGAAGAALARMTGRWHVHGGLVFSAVTVGRATGT